MCSKLELLQAILIILQVDLNLFKMQREHADPISSADPSIVHTLNADVWMMFFASFVFSFVFVFHSLIDAVSGFIRNAGYFKCQRCRARGSAC